MVLLFKNNFYFFDASEQFDIYAFVLFGNVRYFLLSGLAVCLSVIFLSKTLKFTNAKIFVNFLLNIIKTTVENNMSSDRFNYTAYLPFFYLLFFTILIFNIVGLVPFTYTVTSLLVMPFFLSGVNFFFTTLLAVRNNGIFFFAGFLPSGTSIFIAPLLVLIELVSYAVKVLSLSVRLFANMFAGHVLTKVLISLIWALILKISFAPLFLSLLLALLVIAILGLELFICFLQAYVFVNLASIYLDQAVSFLKH